MFVSMQEISGSAHRIAIMSGGFFSVQCNTLYGTKYKITFGVCLHVCVCVGHKIKVQGVAKWHANTGKPRDATSVTRCNQMRCEHRETTRCSVGHKIKVQGVAKWHTNTKDNRDNTEIIAISPWRIMRFRFTRCLVLGRDFRGRRIKQRYFRFRQIQ